MIIFGYTEENILYSNKLWFSTNEPNILLRPNKYSPSSKKLKTVIFLTFQNEFILELLTRIFLYFSPFENTIFSLDKCWYNQYDSYAVLVFLSYKNEVGFCICILYTYSIQYITYTINIIFISKEKLL